MLLLAPLLVAGPAMAAEGILPGYWETTNRLISPIPQKKVEMRCITPKDVAKFMEGPSNRHYTCTYPTRSFAGGKIVLKGQCVSKKGRKVAVAGEGAYTPTTMSLTAQVATEWGGLTIAGKASTEARRVSETCPAPAAS
ncbi:MAG TPA: DUF3617 family protein [Phenylobacterium sp.]